jgi:hypothetical protein
MMKNEIYEIKLYEAKNLAPTEQTRSPKVINEKPKNIIKNFIDLAGKHATT